jgi:hypothetical protein
MKWVDLPRAEHVGMKKSTALILAIVVVPLVAWICRLMVVSIATPSADANLIAYSMLVRASRVNDIAAAKNLSLQAGSLASDQRLASAASTIASRWDSDLKMGVTSKTEENDLRGMAKGVAYGLMNPVGAVVGGIQEIINSRTLDQDTAQLNSIYIPQWRLFEQKCSGAKSTGTVVFLLVLGAGWVGVPIMAKKFAAPGFHRTPEPVMVEVEPVIVTCGQCGAKNRQKAHRAGQKLVCGNCKMELVS